MLREANDTWQYKCLLKLMKCNVRNVTSPSIRRSVTTFSYFRDNFTSCTSKYRGILHTNIAFRRNSRQSLIEAVSTISTLLYVIRETLHERQKCVLRVSNTFVKFSTCVEVFQKKVSRTFCVPDKHVPSSIPTGRASVQLPISRKIRLYLIMSCSRIGYR